MFTGSIPAAGKRIHTEPGRFAELLGGQRRAHSEVLAARGPRTTLARCGRGSRPPRAFQKTGSGLPKSEKGLLWAATRIPKEKAKPDGDYHHDVSEDVLNTIATKLDPHSGPLLDAILEGTYDVLAVVYPETVATGPLRNMLPVDRQAPLLAAMAEWSFNPSDLNRVMELCKRYFKQAGWPNMPVEIELTKTDDYSMSAWNWDGLEYIVKFNFMYLSETCKTPAAKEKIFTHLKGLWDALLQEGIPFKAHWGKINFMTPAFVRERLHFDKFEPLVNPMFLNSYLAERLPETK